MNNNIELDNKFYYKYIKARKMSNYEFSGCQSVYLLVACNNGSTLKELNKYGTNIFDINILNDYIKL